MRFSRSLSKSACTCGKRRFLHIFHGLSVLIFNSPRYFDELKERHILLAVRRLAISAHVWNLALSSRGAVAQALHQVGVLCRSGGYFSLHHKLSCAYYMLLLF